MIPAWLGVFIEFAFLLIVSLPSSTSQFGSETRQPSGVGHLATSDNLMPLVGGQDSYAYWNCHEIPPNMTLCKSVGYSQMVLPNFLMHESLREAIQQANVWVVLVNTKCHPHIQRFLCSLYAPVCLKSHQESKIPPCQELCEDVRHACLPRMHMYGFDWPTIVQCDQFPKQQESMCIPSEKNSGKPYSPEFNPAVIKLILV
ncbi:unnamed protein product [Protopolystoma xenopodis]|uniref:FZ domain-containing protein n=1 Tax=Protopolystoma xenopodis TaxID=117903 RepID=A0A3S5AUF0_9PLAT|nr:unnamed protein product [Protopolystoma xenopodis]